MTRVLFQLYRYLLSPIFQLVFGIQCRYEESCSHYSERVLKEEGFFRGSVLSAKRILSCNRFSH